MEVQESFPNTFRTLSVAIKPRRRVFHMARRSLHAASSSEMEKVPSSNHVVSQSVARHAAKALVSSGEREETVSSRCHMRITLGESLFFASGFGFVNFGFFTQQRTVGQLALVVHGSFLSDERHIGGRGTFNRSAQNSVV